MFKKNEEPKKPDIKFSNGNEYYGDQKSFRKFLNSLLKRR